MTWVSCDSLCVSIQDEHYRDLCFDTSSFLEKVRSGGIPTTSQPPIGDVLAAYEEHGDEEILNICMADVCPVRIRQR